MKTSPIYELNDNHFNMNKLEHISELFTTSSSNPTQYWFTYEINTHVYDYWNTDKNIIEEEREKLIKEWRNFCGEEII